MPHISCDGWQWTVTVSSQANLVSLWTAHHLFTTAGELLVVIQSKCILQSFLDVSEIFVLSSSITLLTAKAGPPKIAATATQERRHKMWFIDPLDYTTLVCMFKSLV